MAKQLKSTRLERLDFDTETLDNLINYLEGLRGKYKEKFKTLRIVEDYSYDYGYNYDLVGDSIETDEQEQERLKLEELIKNRHQESDRREYERLKKIFEPDKK